ncbi:hypothetical protein PV767_00005, partial [Stenotrophomonas rhizophila]
MAVGSAYDHTLRLRGGDIDRGLAHAAGNQQTQARERGQQPGGDRRALTHHHQIADKKKTPLHEQRGFRGKNPGDDLLSHGLG